MELQWSLASPVKKAILLNPFLIWFLKSSNSGQFQNVFGEFL